MTLRTLSLVSALVVCGSTLHGQEATSPVVKRSAYEDLQMFGQVLNQIRVNHPDSVDMHELFMAAVAGMVHAADPHSFVIPAVRLVPGKEAALREGKLQPVPVSFTLVGGSPVVVGVAAGTSAQLLDLLPGDELVAVDGATVSAASAEELEIALAGPKGSAVRLTVERRRSDGSLARLEREVRRESFDEESAVALATLLDSATGYVRVTTFMGERVADDLHAALDRLERAGMQRLILDLRDNGGGNVAEAAHVAGEFLPRGSIIYTSEGRKPEIADTGRVDRSRWSTERRYPMLVLVNAGTASASELVAGALQDHDRALIIGRPTFGKSLLMRGFPMADGSILELVIGHVRTPCGRVVQRQYRAITRRDYYRLARAERDTAGRPSCTTDAGRRVYGGGGIFPDVALPPPVVMPRWMEDVEEQQLSRKWAAGYVDVHKATLASAGGFANSALPASDVADFRTFATRQGVTIPIDAAADSALRVLLMRRIGAARWGREGAYRVEIAHDAIVGNAAANFAQASRLLTREP